MGKTSLLIRGSKEARTAGARTVYIDYQKLNLTQLVSLDVFYRSLCEWLAEELELEVSVESFWNTRRTANMNFERFLERELLPRVGGHFVLAMDETDRLFEGWKESGDELGIGVACEERGGLSDGNFIWHVVPTLDGLGPWGDNDHCSERSADGSKLAEYVELTSFVPKAMVNVAAIVKLMNLDAS